MARYTRLRNHGAIPERQHDAFLLSLLLALVFSVGVFLLQALMPTIVFLMQLLGPEPTPPEPEDAMPFVLVDFEYPDEELDPDQAEAEANLTRQARQTEQRDDLEEDRPTVDEGVDEILTDQAGNPGLATASSANESEVIAEPQPDVDSPETEPVPDPDPEPEPPEPEAPELPEVAEVPPAPPEPPPLPEPPPEPPETVPPPEPDLPPEPVAPPEPEPPVEPPVEPPPAPEPPPEPEPPEPIEPEPPVEPETEAEPDETPQSEPAAELVDLASLPQTADGFLDPETRRLAEVARQAPETLTRRPEPEEFFVPTERPTSPAPPQEPQERSDRAGRPRRQPTFRRIDGASSAGGAPPRRNTGSAVRLIDADNNMAILAHRYGPYMKKVAEALQASLLRQIVLSPMAYSQGQVRIRFGISPDGTLTYYDTVFPTDGLDAERLLSERMLREAAPFDPLTAEMQRDELFQKMSVIVTLY